MKRSFGLAAALVLGLALVGCGPKESFKETVGNATGQIEPAPVGNQGTAGNSVNPNQPVSNTPVQTGTGATQPGSSNPTPAGLRVDLPVGNDSYKITQVKALASGKGITVTGKLRAFEAVGAYAVKDADGKVLTLSEGKQEGVIRASKGAPEWGDFTINIALADALKGKNVTLEFFVHSANDGSRQDLLSLTIAYK